jgi:hypothetical protein
MRLPEASARDESLVRSQLLILLVASLITACTVNHRVAVRGNELHRKLATLRSTGAAEVEVVRFANARRQASTATVRLDQQVWFEGKLTPISELARDCKDVVPFAEDRASQSECMLVKHRDAWIDLRRHSTRSVGLAVKYTAQASLAIAFFGGAIGGGICEAACKDDSTAKDVGRVALGTAGAILVFFVVWFIIDCYDGSPGCKD